MQAGVLLERVRRGGRFVIPEAERTAVTLICGATRKLDSLLIGRLKVADTFESESTTGSGG